MFATKFADLQNNHYLCGVQAFGRRLIPSACYLFVSAISLNDCKDTNFICAKQIFVCFLRLIKQIATQSLFINIQ